MPDTTTFVVADLPQNRPIRFDLRPSAHELGAIAADLNLSAVRKLRFTGQIAARGKHDWLLTGRLGATVEQPCVVTLTPVTTRIETNVRRVFLAHLPEPELGEVEMHEDDNIELLGQEIDPFVVMTESLSLVVPQYPRADGATLGDSVFTQPGQKPMTDQDARPFAGLAELGKTLKNEDEG